MANVKDSLFYTKSHEWIDVEFDTFLIGITDHAQELLGDIVYLELPGLGDEFKKGDAFGLIESVKAASDIYVPVDAEVVEVNSALADEPSEINRDAYAAWLCKFRIKNKEQLKDLLTAQQYQEEVQ